MQRHFYLLDMTAFDYLPRFFRSPSPALRTLSSAEGSGATLIIMDDRFRKRAVVSLPGHLPLQPCGFPLIHRSPG
jgi:hypothetical protein